MTDFDPASPDPTQTDECEPTAQIPAWWSGFLFHVLNPRQLSMFVYLTMLSDRTGSCNPTIEQIRKDLGLLSATMVFDALAVLESYGFFVRKRRSLPGSRQRRNVYHRTACQYTILRLLECDQIDAHLHPIAASASPASDQSRELVRDGLRLLLEGAFDRYDAVQEPEKKTVLAEVLGESLRVRPRGIYL